MLAKYVDKVAKYNHRKIIIIVAVATVAVFIAVTVFIGLHIQKNNETRKSLDSAANKYVNDIQTYINRIQPGPTMAKGSVRYVGSINGEFEKVPKLPVSRDAKLSKSYQYAQRLEAAISMDRKYISELILVYGNNFYENESTVYRNAQNTFYTKRSGALLSVRGAATQAIIDDDYSRYKSDQIAYFNSLRSFANEYTSTVSKVELPEMYFYRVNKLSEELKNISVTSKKCSDDINAVKSNDDVEAIADIVGKCNKNINKIVISINRYSIAVSSYASYLPESTIPAYLEMLKNRTKSGLKDSNDSAELISRKTAMQDGLVTAKSVLPQSGGSSDQSFDAKADIARVTLEEVATSLDDQDEYDELEKSLSSVQDDLTLLDGYNDVSGSANDAGGYFGSVLAALIKKNDRPQVSNERSDRERYGQRINDSVKQLESLNTPAYVKSETGKIITIYKDAAKLATKYEDVSSTRDSRADVRRSYDVIGSKLDEATAVLETMADKLDDYGALKTYVEKNIDNALETAKY